MDERDLFARMLMAEAGNQGELGMRAVGSVIDNRRRAGNFGGDTFTDVMLSPGQFSPANSITGYAKGEQGVDLANLQPTDTAYRIADEIMGGEYEDPTGGAVNFLNPDISQPSWLKDMRNTTRIGDHLFGTAGMAGSGRATATLDDVAAQGGGRLAFDDEQRARLASEQAAISRGETMPMQMPDSVPSGDGSDFMSVFESVKARQQRVQAQPMQTRPVDPNAGREAVAGLPTISTPNRGDPLTALGTRAITTRPQLPSEVLAAETAGLPRPQQPGGGGTQVASARPVPPPVASRFNPEPVYAFANLGMDQVTEKQIETAFGPGVQQLSGGVTGFLSQAVGGKAAYGLPEDDRDFRGVTEVVAAATQPPGGREEPGVLNIERKRSAEKRRHMAADMLEILSVGLGQMGSGNPVDVSQVLQMQAERRAAAAEAPVNGEMEWMLQAGNEAEFAKYLARNGASQYIPLIGGGREIREEALRAAQDYQIAAPERVQKQERLARLAQFNAAQFETPEEQEAARQAVFNSPAVADAVEEAYAETMSTPEGAAGGLTHLASQIAKGFEAVDDGYTADLVRKSAAAGDNVAVRQYGNLLYERRNRPPKEDLTKFNGEQLAQKMLDVGLDPSLYMAVEGDQRVYEEDEMRSVLSQHNEMQRTLKRMRPEEEYFAQTAVEVLSNGPQDPVLGAAYDNYVAAKANGYLRPEHVENLKTALGGIAQDMRGVPTPSNVLSMIGEMQSNRYNVPQGLIERAVSGTDPSARTEVSELYKQFSRDNLAPPEPVEGPDMPSPAGVQTQLDAFPTMPSATRSSIQTTIDAALAAQDPQTQADLLNVAQKRLADYAETADSARARQTIEEEGEEKEAVATPQTAAAIVRTSNVPEAEMENLLGRLETAAQMPDPAQRDLLVKSVMDDVSQFGGQYMTALAEQRGSAEAPPATLNLAGARDILSVFPYDGGIRQSAEQLLNSAAMTQDPAQQQLLIDQAVSVMTSGMEEFAKEEGETTAATLTEKASELAQYANVAKANPEFNDPRYRAIALASGTDVALEQYGQDVAEEQEATAVQELAGILGGQLEGISGRDGLTEALSTATTMDDLNEVFDNLQDVTLPGELGVALAANSATGAMALIERLRLAGAGQTTPASNAAASQLVSFTDVLDTQEQTIIQRQGLVRSMARLQEMVADPNFNTAQTGPLAPGLSQIRGIARQVFNDDVANLFQDEEVSAVVRLATAIQGEFFGQMRPEGSGATTETEGAYYRAGMAGPADEAVKLALTAQRLRKDYEYSQIEQQARRDWLTQTLEADDFNKRIVGRTGLQEFIDQRVEESGYTAIPSIDYTQGADAVLSQLDEYYANNQITGDTVIRVVPPGENAEPTFIFVNQLGAQEWNR